MFFKRLIEALNSYKVEYAIAGGVAVALHGAIRGTVDIDLALLFDEKNFEQAAKALQSLGLTSRLPVTAKEVFQFREEYLKNRNLMAWSFVNLNNPAEIVDLLLTHDLKKMKVEKIPFQGLRIKLISLEDLIRMKSGTGRQQDQEDIKALKILKEGL